MRNKDFALLLIGSEKMKNELDGAGKLKLIFKKNNFRNKRNAFPIK